MTQVYLGTITTFGFQFQPRGYAYCNGQLLAISTNTALFSLLGTTYGGNGQNNFALPNLQGRQQVHQGQLAGGGNYQMGQNGGTENTTLNQTNLPAHTHAGALNAVQTKALVQAPAAGSLLARAADNSSVGSQPAIYVPSGTSGTQVGLGGLTISPTGNNVPFSNLDPYLTVNMCIATQGIFPSRN